MIIHASIPADEPERVARVIAELWKGEAVPFPPIERSWMAFAHDGRGTEIEVAPRDIAFVPGPEEIGYAPQPATPKHCAVHLLITSVLSAEDIIAIGQREGWAARRCRRGGPGAMGFDLVELWLENAFMIEVAYAESKSQYLAFMTGAPAREMFGFQQAA